MRIEREKTVSRRSIALFAICGLLIAPALIAGLVLRMIDRQDEIADAERVRQARGLLSYYVSVNEAAVKANSLSDEAFQKIVVEADFAWFQENLGFAAFADIGYEASLVLKHDGSVWTGAWEDGAIGWLAGSVLAKTYKRLMHRILVLPGNEPVSAFVRSGDELMFLAMSEITPRNAALTDAQRPHYLLFLFRFDAERIQSLREIGAWKDLDLDLAPGAPQASALAIRDPDGKTLGHLVWDTPKLGSAAFREYLPLILSACAVAALAIGGLLLRIIQANRYLRSARQKALDLADRDILTGAANRRKMQRLIAEALEGAASFQVMMIDFDGFKGVNDNFGHKFGDALLVEMTGRMQRLCPEGSLLARLGGDEFAIVFRGAAEAAMECGQDLIFAISSPFLHLGHQVAISASIGIATGSPGMAEETVLHCADVAMYDAKASKPGAVRFYHARMDQETRLQSELDADMRAGLGRGEFWVAFQPIFSIGDGRIMGFEALARWTHPERGQVPPNVFIPVAEQSRFIGRLGEFILREACLAMAGSPDQRLSVNLSPVQMLDAGLIETVARILAETGFPADRLELEITEGCLIEHTDRAGLVIERLQALGVSVSLDDFGAGYASVSYLRRLNLDKVKIDRSFVGGIGTDDGARGVLEAMVNLCRAFGMPITVEGVETVEQAEMLSAMGCDQLQGYLIGRPLPEATALTDETTGWKLAGA